MCSLVAERAPPQTGVSAGALTATLAACDVDMRVRDRKPRLATDRALTPPQASVDLAYALTLEMDLYKRKGGLAGVWGPLIKRWLHELLPEDAASVCSGRVGLFSLALWPPVPRTVFIGEFQSKDDLVEAAMASVHIPYFLDGRMTCVRACARRGVHALTLPPCSRRFRGMRCIDGSVAARRDVVDTRRKQPATDAPPTLLLCVCS